MIPARQRLAQSGPPPAGGWPLPVTSSEVAIAVDGTSLSGTLALPADAVGVVAFAHGSGSGRLSPRNQAVASRLNEAGIATLLFDLLTDEEAAHRANVFDVPLLADRLLAATEWLGHHPLAGRLAVGYFGASTGAAAALWAAAEEPRAAAVVSRGGRPDLAEARLGEVKAPTLLIVGGLDEIVLELNRGALARLTCRRELTIVPGATHLFEEPGTLEAVAEHARAWFSEYLRPSSAGKEATR